MQTVIFHSTVYGPVHSRRLGVSLGINLMPNNGKICSFDCLYCEAGFNAQGAGDAHLPTPDEVEARLREQLTRMHSDGSPLDVITFSGNGEPTLHPDFETVVDRVLSLRNEFYPAAKVTVITNSTMAHRQSVQRALLRVDNILLKLDSAIDATFRIINRPANPLLTPADIISTLAQYGDRCVVQTMMISGEYNGTAFDNTTDEEIEALISAYRTIGPREVMLYSLDRPAPADHLVKIPLERLRQIGKRITEATGVRVEAH